MTERFFAGDSPPTAAVADDSAITFGLEFTVAESVLLRGIAFFQASTNSPSTATRQVSLYSTTDGVTGVQLVTPEDLPVSGAGWNTRTLTTPVTLSPGTVYRAVVYYPAGRWVQTVDFFETTGRDTPSGNATAPPVADALSNDQMSFATGVGLQFPTTSFDESNYWIDAIIDTPAADVASAVTIPAVTADASIEDVVTRRASASTVVKAALLDRLRTRAANSARPMYLTNVLDRQPVIEPNVFTDSSREEYIAITGARGVYPEGVLRAGNLPWDERFTLDIRIQALGTRTLDTQEVMDDRVNVLLYEVLAEISTQKTWISTYTGVDGAPDLSVFSYLWLVPDAFEILATQVPGRPQAAGAGVILTIACQARRTFV